uniref:Putative secreted protein n=1 Tax=Ixodes ricinus TaxID=34613 RepID=A0A6B0UCI6_IXORI
MWLISLVLEVFVASVLCRASIEKCFQIAASEKLAVGLIRLLGKNFSLYSICFDFIHHISFSFYSKEYKRVQIKPGVYIFKFHKCIKLCFQP